LYADKNRAGELPNPGFTDSLGNLYFFANPGTYTLDMGTFTIPITVMLHPDEPIGGGGGAVQGYKHAQPTSVNAVSIAHGLDFAPGGITCLQNDGVQVDQERVAHPAPGVTEVFFGAGYQFAGDIYLS
jgi:hypothetical protein